MASIANPEKKSLRVLLTGFGGFKGMKTIPSWLAAKPLDNETLTFTQPAEPGHPHSPKYHAQVEAHISALEVPTSYSAVLNTIPPLHASKQYDIILHLGVGNTGGFLIERLAHKTGHNKPDAEDLLCDPVHGEPNAERGFGRGFEQFGEELTTDVDVDGVVGHLESKGLVHTSPSDDAGRYLCGFMYFCSLACAQKEVRKTKVLFMHVPLIGLPYEVEDMTNAAEGVIEYLALHA